MAKPRKSGNITLRDELVAQLASSTLVERFSVDNRKGWEISFNKLSDGELERLLETAMQNLSANVKLGCGDDSEDGHRAIRFVNLHDSEAQGFARAVAISFCSEALN